MSYKLEKPCSDIQKADFIVEYNHKLGLKIVETETAIFALEANEIMQDGVPIVNENYEKEMAKTREENFRKEFFETSLGWIRRKVTMKNGAKKDFLSDLLIPIKTGLEMGQNVEIITYKTPDFSLEIIDFTTLQEVKIANENFIKECLNQVVKDFNG